jgi:hypothetical protein
VAFFRSAALNVMGSVAVLIRKVMNDGWFLRIDSSGVATLVDMYNDEFRKNPQGCFPTPREPIGPLPLDAVWELLEAPGLLYRLVERRACHPVGGFGLPGSKAGWADLGFDGSAANFYSLNQ